MTTRAIAIALPERDSSRDDLPGGAIKYYIRPLDHLTLPFPLVAFQYRDFGVFTNS